VPPLSSVFILTSGQSAGSVGISTCALGSSPGNCSGLRDVTSRVKGAHRLSCCARDNLSGVASRRGASSRGIL
jgi:hypothetical protein